VRVVLVLTALDVEARALARLLGLPPRAEGPGPRFGAGVLEVVAVGLRGSALDERLGRAPRPSLVVSAGTCGALDPMLRTGALVIPEVVIGTDGRRQATDPAGSLRRTGTLLTVAEVVDRVDTKARLWIETGALAVDMESATIVAWARERGLPAAVVRAVSDRADEAVPADLARLVEPGGRLRAGAAVRAALARPRVLADALALGRGAGAALRAVASAVAALSRSA
jgi:adenosylhomocysteine nucleosidase